MGLVTMCPRATVPITKVADLESVPRFASSKHPGTASGLGHRREGSFERLPGVSIRIVKV